MNVDRIFKKKALQFIIDASKSTQAMSAIKFFRDNFILDMELEYKEEYRSNWGLVLLACLNLLPKERKVLLCASIVESRVHGEGFHIFPSDIHYDIIAMKALQGLELQALRPDAKIKTIIE